MAQITVVFNSYKEMMDFARRLAGTEDSPEPAEKETVDKAIPYGRQIAKDFPAANTKAEDKEAEDTDTAEPEEETAAKSYTLVDVRGKLSELTKAGKKQQVQELIKGFGVDKLSQIPEDLYPEVMQKAGEL